LNCRHCGSALHLPFIDLGSAPPSNAYLDAGALNQPEARYPLRAWVCTACWLVQAEDSLPSSVLFAPDYAYFSSVSTSWLAHAERYVGDMVNRFALGSHSKVIEVASNDGYLLQYVKARAIPCLGIEPTAGTAQQAIAKGITVVQEFFGTELARRLVEQGHAADLTAANNVLAHVPGINDFVAGFALLLKPQGVATFEFPHLLKQVQYNQFDTVYHEHFSYLSLTTVSTIFSRNGLKVFDVEELPTHGGSLRVYAQRADTGKHETSQRVNIIMGAENRAGMMSEAFYAGFQVKAERVKTDFLAFLASAKQKGETVAAYGAAAKGNTLLNYAGVKPDLIPYVVDRNPAKQGKFMPGSHIPIVDEDRLKHDQPHYIVLLPWNLKTELAQQLNYVKAWRARLVTAVPHLEIL
jgi:C-methyltransferase C-terminal domain/Putative zinc binding domain/Methyltransferase domain